MTSCIFAGIRAAGCLLSLPVLCDCCEESLKMPKYLALDYVAEALQHRQSQVERMQVPAPHHIEFVDAYIHNGEVADTEYRTPWEHLDEFSHSKDKSFLLSLPSDENIQADFHHLCSGLRDTNDITHKKLEQYHVTSSTTTSTTRAGGECFDNFGSDDELTLLSQDIDMAIQQFLPTSHFKQWVDSTTGEVFSTQELNHDRLTTDKDIVDEDALELPESVDHFESVLDTIPTVDDLATRLKPKMIQDPLLDDSGQPYSYKNMFSDEHHMVTSQEVLEEEHQLTLPFEEFNRHSLSHNDSNDLQDLILEVDHEETSPVTNKEVTLSLLDTNNTQEESASEKETSLTQQQSNEDLKMLTTHFSAPPLTPDSLSIAAKLTRFSPVDPHNQLGLSGPAAIDLTKFNKGPNESCDSEDSGLCHAYLESPLLPPPFTSHTSSPLTKQLGPLEPIPLSPEGEIKLRLLSPNSEKSLLTNLRKKDNEFDPILALTIPCPTTEDGVAGVSDGDIVCELMQMMELNPLDTNDDGSESEELAWDPLVDSYEEMAIAKQDLITPTPLNFGPLELGGRDDDIAEGLFERDKYVELMNQDEGELPLEVCDGEMMEEVKKKSNNMEVLESDIPSLQLQSGYPVISSRPTSLRNQPVAQRLTANKDTTSTTTNAPPTHTASSSSAAWSLIQISNSTSASMSRGAPPLYDLNIGSGNGPRCSKYPSSNSTTIAKRNTTQWENGTSTSIPGFGGTGSALDDFMLLRFSHGINTRASNSLRSSNDGDGDGLYCPGRKRMLNNDDNRESSNVGPDSKRSRVALSTTDIGAELMFVDDKITSPVFHDVYFTGEYQTSLLRIEGFASTLLTGLQRYGFQCRGGAASVRQLHPDNVKFFLKQQQKKMVDCNEAGEILKSCQLSASLYIVCTVLDLLTHCTLGVGQRRFSSLCDRYGELIGNRMDIIKQELLSLQLASKDTTTSSSSLDPHPKLREMVGVVCRWMKNQRKSWREKAVVVVEREFNCLSGEILDFLQSIPNMKSCVFSFASDETSNSLYLKAVEERFHHYDCLVVPPTSLTDHAHFPWERVTLLIEYEQLKQPLFPTQSNHGGGDDDGASTDNDGGCVNVVDRLKLKEYVTLRSVCELSSSITSVGANTGRDVAAGGEDISQMQYTFIASENITNNTQLLQLMETRYNILIIPRDYPWATTTSTSGATSSSNCKPRHKPSSSSSKKLIYADLILDQSTGIVIRPLSLLCVDSGARALIGTLTALSLQYETCWLLLYTDGEHNYPFQGKIPTNLARLYASVSTYCPRLDNYRVKILTLFSIEEMVKITRRIAEETHKCSKVWSLAEWTERGWLNEDMGKGERMLLAFPCINSFSAQCMLREFTIGEVVSMEIDQLKSNFPWIPTKVIEFLYKICHSNAIANECTDVSPSLPTSAAAQTPRDKTHTKTNIEDTRHDKTTLRSQQQNTERKSSFWQNSDKATGNSFSEQLPSTSTNANVIVLSSQEDQDDDPPRYGSGSAPSNETKVVTSSLNWRSENYQNGSMSHNLKTNHLQDDHENFDLVVISDDEAQDDHDFSPLPPPLPTTTTTSSASATHNASGLNYFTAAGGGAGGDHRVDLCDPNSTYSMTSYGLDRPLHKGTSCNLDDSLEEYEMQHSHSNDTLTLNPSTVAQSDSLISDSTQNFELKPDAFQDTSSTDDSFMMFEMPKNSTKSDFIDLTTQHKMGTANVTDFNEPLWSCASSVNNHQSSASVAKDNKNLKKVSFNEHYPNESSDTMSSQYSNRKFSNFLSTSNIASSSKSSSFPHHLDHTLNHTLDHTPFSLTTMNPTSDYNSNTFDPPLPNSIHHPIIKQHRPAIITSTTSEHQYGAAHATVPNSSAMRLFSSSQRLGKTPTQKQIRETVMRDIVLSDDTSRSDPSVNSIKNKTRLAREYYSGPPPASFMASSVVRNTPSCVAQRTPVKALDLGIGRKSMSRESAFRLKSNDRVFAGTSSSLNTRELESSRQNVDALLNRCMGIEPKSLPPPPLLDNDLSRCRDQRQSESSRSETSVRRSLFQPLTGTSVTVGHGIKGRPAVRANVHQETSSNLFTSTSDDLKRFQEHQISSEKANFSQSAVNFPAAFMQPGVVRCRGELADPWSGGGRGRIGNASPGMTGEKRCYSETRYLHTQPHDGLVPTVSPTSPPSARASLYSSPINTTTHLAPSSSSSTSGGGRVWSSELLSPLRKRRLHVVCQKNTSSSDGQTRLRFK